MIMVVDQGNWKPQATQSPKIQAVVVREATPVTHSLDLGSIYLHY